MLICWEPCRVIVTRSKCAQSLLSRRRPLLISDLRRTAQPPGLATKADFSPLRVGLPVHQSFATMAHSCRATKAGCASALLLPGLAPAVQISCAPKSRIWESEGYCLKRKGSLFGSPKANALNEACS